MDMSNAEVIQLRWRPAIHYGVRLRLVRIEYSERLKLPATMSQEKFAQLLELSSSAYKQWEAGNNQPQDIIATSKRIAEITGVDVSWLLDIIDLNGPDDGGDLQERTSRWNVVNLDSKRIEAAPAIHTDAEAA